MPHLLVAISSHGFGHAMPALLVVNALRQRLPSLQITLRTTVSPFENTFAGRFSTITCI
jgi:hypothetical protein